MSSDPIKYIVKIRTDYILLNEGLFSCPLSEIQADLKNKQKKARNHISTMTNAAKDVFDVIPTPMCV